MDAALILFDGYSRNTAIIISRSCMDDINDAIRGIVESPFSDGLFHCVLYSVKEGSSCEESLEYFCFKGEIKHEHEINIEEYAG